jgi:putative peptidoglycan lipid II flippase
MGLAVLAQPILAALFERGAFGARETAATAPALAAYAAGLPAFVLVKLLAAGFFARQDTRTPVLLAVLSLAVNAAAMGILGFLLGFAHVGVAMATSIAGWVNALGLWIILHRRGHFSFDARSRRVLPRLIGATIGMGVVLALLLVPLEAALAGRATERLLALAALVAAGLASFAAFAFLSGAADWQEVARRLRRRAA